MQIEHDEHLEPVLLRMKELDLTLNKAKCVFSKPQVKFLGLVLSASGISPDPDKVSAVEQMRPPTSMGEVCRFLGMVNQLSKFVPNL